jgi:membrane protein DedA with SNARE-associated domain
VALVVAAVAIVVATVIASSKLLLFIFDELDLVAYLGLFLACWIGAGGAIVPVPGVRAISWVMIVQQGAALDPLVVPLVAAAAMVLGQSSYFFATRAASRRMAADGEADDVDAESADAQPDSDAAEVEESRRAQYIAAAKRRVEGQIHEHGMRTVYLTSALPSPVTTLATTAAAGAGMTYLKFLIASFAGFLTLSTVLVLVGQGLLAALRSFVGPGWFS